MLISCRQVKKSFGDTVILAGADLDIGRGDRIGLVGRNGSGKTTLANILAGCLEYDEGSLLTAREPISIGYLRQTGSEPESYVNKLDGQREPLGEFQRLVSQMGIDKVQDWPRERWQNLSGGEKTKLALAGVWASRPDLIILDEPTNHMDYQGVKYLISELASYQGAVIIISHDRYFLDQTVAQIAELENGHIRIYKGNYSAYREAKRRDRESRQHVYESQQKEQRKVEIAVTKLKTWSAKAHRESRHKGDGQMGGKEYFRKKAKKRDQAVKSQLKRLEKMSREQVERPGKELRVNFDLNAGGKGARRLLEASEISKAFGDLVLFKDSSFYINRGEKVGILGPNGCGKTTLIKTILGEETVDRGAIFLSPAARIAYVGQELPRGKEGTLQELVATWTREQQKRAFQLMIQLGIPYDRLSIAMGELSRGERMKIAMGLAIMGECDLLILDEPTNHLDLYSREALEESLTQFPGTTMIISHDRYLLQEVCQYLLVFDQQKVSRIEGKLEYYLTKRPLDKDSFESQTPAEPDNQEELLLLETKIAWILSELNRIKPGTSDYLALDQEYTRLARRKNELRPTRR